MVAAVAMLLGAGLLIDLDPGRANISPADSSRPLGETAKTEIDQVSLKDVPSAALDLARSGLSDMGITLPDLDLSALKLPDVTIPVPSGVLPTSTEPSMPSSEPSKSSTEPTVPSSEPTVRSTEPTTTSTEPSTTTTGRTPASAKASAPPVGAMVKHLTRSTPFKMVGFTWTKPLKTNLADATMLLRSKSTSGKWSDWTELEPIQTAGKPSAKHPGGTEPVWVGDSKEIQVALADNGFAIPAAESTGDALVGQILGSGSDVLKNLAGTVFPELTAALLNPDSLLSLGSSMLTTLSGGPQVISRAAWGADESIRCSQPTISPSLDGAIVHHTAGSNDYTAAQSAEIVRGIYAYHARTMNWCDIGYNVLVDKYGQIFEGAFGGLDRNVEGTHTGGFNKNTVGVSLIGNLDEVAPSGPMLAAAGRFLKWRLNKAGRSASGTANLTSEYFTQSKFPAGTQTHLPMIAGHRDYNSTSCPGNLGYPALAQIRALAGGIALPERTEQTPEATTPSAPAS